MTRLILKPKLTAAALLLSGLVFGGARSVYAQGTLVDVAAAEPDFSTLVTAVQAAGLGGALSADGPYTVFAPNNAAFAKLPAGTVESLLQDTNRLRQILLYHVSPGRVRSTDLEEGKLITLQGAALGVDLSSGAKINNATVIAPDKEAVNGVIHVIDTVLLPPGSLVDMTTANPDFSTLAAALQAAGLLDALNRPSPLTVLAPNNAAFAKLPAGTVDALLQDTNRLRQVLLYHLIRGRVRSTDLQPGKVITVQGAAANVTLENGVRINDSAVVTADIEAANGVIHVIDTVLLPPPNIVELASANPELSTLVTAAQAAGLVGALQSSGPYTVFAPNNAAFAKLPAGTLEALLQDTNRLGQILLYHLSHGPRLRAADLRTGLLQTMHGAPAKVTVESGGVRVNQATVLAADIEALNGVVHVIDEVILPGGGFDNLSLVASVKGRELTLVWPVINGQPQILEVATDLVSPNWTRVMEQPIVSDGVSKLVLPASLANQYFRIRSATE